MNFYATQVSYGYNILDKLKTLPHPTGTKIPICKTILGILCTKVSISVTYLEKKIEVLVTFTWA